MLSARRPEGRRDTQGAAQPFRPAYRWSMRRTLRSDGRDGVLCRIELRDRLLDQGPALTRRLGDLRLRDEVSRFDETRLGGRVEAAVRQDVNPVLCLVERRLQPRVLLFSRIALVPEEFCELPPGDVDVLDRVETLQERDDLIELRLSEGESTGRSWIVEFRAGVEANGVFEGLRDVCY